MEGRTQLTRAAVPPPAAAREDWKIVRALSEVAGATLPYDDLVGVRARLAAVAPHLVRYDVVEATSPAVAQVGLKPLRAAAGKKASGAQLENPIVDFYQTDPIARASQTMAKCSATWGKAAVEAEGRVAVAQ
ncbi:hypothetical protein BC938DRAFT_473614 [Jimgerdemannia flammicorona]|uniref:Molybdopterin oxidoreductase domain-containing protein n=1 Tax=Jimgerdemannia flammicorona TaxID=994334 RepID=A0A433Q3M1_9FUNG|nr:hypothetical protein BC938DRAFT_473614 [Jimgerdemannia flammicorona]